MLLRPGGIGVDELARVLGRRRCADADADAPRASGTLASHYAPRTPARLVAADVLRAEIAQLDERDEIVAVLARTVARPREFAGVWMRRPPMPRATRTTSTRTCARSTPRTPMPS